MAVPGATKWMARPAKSFVLRNGLPFASVIAALLLEFLFQYLHVPHPFAAFALSAIAITFWYGGTKPGIVAAVAAAEKSLDLSLTRYRGGITSYLEVTTAQSAALVDEVTAVNILGRRMTSAVLLIQALGGGWDSSSLPARPECCGKVTGSSNDSSVNSKNPSAK